MTSAPSTHTLHLTIRATNGATWDTAEFHPHQKIALVDRKAVEHFVAASAMTDGDYALALVGDGAPQVLNDAANLEDAGVTDHATLVLVTREPQVDGACTRS